MEHRITVVHGESRTLFYVVEVESGDPVESYHTREEAEAARELLEAPRCAECGEASTVRGSMRGLVHRWGPRDHAFVSAAD